MRFISPPKTQILIIIIIIIAITTINQRLLSLCVRTLGGDRRRQQYLFVFTR